MAYMRDSKGQFRKGFNGMKPVGSSSGKKKKLAGQLKDRRLTTKTAEGANITTRVRDVGPDNRLTTSATVTKDPVGRYNKGDTMPAGAKLKLSKNQQQRVDDRQASLKAGREAKIERMKPAANERAKQQLVDTLNRANSGKAYPTARTPAEQQKRLKEVVDRMPAKKTGLDAEKEQLAQDKRSLASLEKKANKTGADKAKINGLKERIGQRERKIKDAAAPKPVVKESTKLRNRKESAEEVADFDYDEYGPASPEYKKSLARVQELEKQYRAALDKEAGKAPVVSEQKKVQASNNAKLKSAVNQNPQELISNAAVMYGTGSPQHLKAIEKYGHKPPAKKAASRQPAEKKPKAAPKTSAPSAAELKARQKQMDGLTAKQRSAINPPAGTSAAYKQAERNLQEALENGDPEDIRDAQAELALVRIRESDAKKVAARGAGVFRY